MTATLTIYSSEGAITFPAKSNDGRSNSFDTLSQPPVEVVLDRRGPSGGPELTVQVSATTTFWNPDQPERLFFRYRPANPDAMFSEFYDVLRTNEVQDLSTAVDESTELAEERGVPEELITSGLFREGWEFDDDAALRVSSLLAHTELEAPDLDEIEQSVLTSLAGTQQLRFGVESSREGLKLAQWLFEETIDGRIVLTNGTEYTWPADDLFLVPGYDSNLEPLDTSTEKGYQDRIDEEKRDWKTKRKQNSEALIDHLLLEHENHILYNDLADLHRYVSYDDSSDLRTDAARAVRDHYDDVRDDPYLDSKQKAEVISALGDRLDDEREQLGENLRSNALERFEEALNRSFGTTVVAELRLYRWYDNLEDVLSDPHDSTLRGTDKQLKSFKRDWQEFTSHDSVPDDVEEFVRDRLRETISDKKSNLEKSLPTRINSACEAAVDAASETNDHPEEVLDGMRQFRELLDNPENADPGPETNREIKAATKILESLNKYNYRGAFYDAAAEALSEGLADAYYEYIDDSMRYYLEQHTDNRNKNVEYINAIQRVNNTGELHGETDKYSGYGVRALEQIAAAHSSRYLLEEHKQQVRSNVESRVEGFIEALEENYEKQIDIILEDIEGDRTHQYIIKINIYEEMEAILDTPDRTDDSHYSEVRRFRTVWQEIVDDDLVSDEWRREYKKTVRNDLEKRKQTADQFIDDSDSQVAGVVSYKTVAVILGVALFAVLLVSLLGFFPWQGGGGDSTPALELDAPAAGEQIEGDGILVSGQATAPQVDLTFISRNSDLRETRTVPVSDGTFEQRITNLPVGEYRLVAAPDGTDAETPMGQETRTTTFFKYAGGDPYIQITDIVLNGSTVTVEGTLSAIIGNATVNIYDSEGTLVDSQSQETSKAISVEASVNENGPYVIELIPTHASGSTLVDRRVIN